MKLTVKLSAAVVLVALTLFAGNALGNLIRGPRDVVTHTDTVEVAPSDYEPTKEALAIARGDITGLRARLRGLEERPPRTLYLTDSVLVTDTVFVVVDQHGQLTYQLATSLSEPAPVELRSGIDVSDCDDGFQIRDRQVVCNRAVWGHLYLTPRPGLRSAMAVLEWEPSYRSPWQFSVAYVSPYSNPDQVDFWVGRRVQLW